MLTKDEIIQKLANIAAKDGAVRSNPESTEEKIRQVDIENSQELNEVLDQIGGWPRISEYDEQTSRNAWLIAQHADHDLNFQKRCLGLMQILSNQEINPKNIAYLADRILVAEGKPQIYGTQWDDQGDTLVLQLVDNFNDINERRLEVGLGTIEEYAKEMEEAYGLKTEIPA